MSNSICDQIKESIEHAGTLKPLIGGGLFGGKPKASDKIYFEASHRGVSELTLIGELNPQLGTYIQTFLFSAEGKPQNVQEAVEIVKTLDEKQLDYLNFGINTTALRPTLSRCCNDQEYLEGAKAVDALFGRKWPEAVFGVSDLYFEEKEIVGLACNYVVWAINNDVLYVLPLSDKMIRKVTKK